MRQTYEVKEIYAKRKETIELVFAAMNIKKLTTWTWQVA
jgi:hypothetical protein